MLDPVSHCRVGGGGGLVRVIGEGRLVPHIERKEEDTALWSD